MPTPEPPFQEYKNVFFGLKVLYKILCLWVKHPVSPCLVALTEALQKEKVNPYLQYVLILVKVTGSHFQNGRSLV